MYLNPSTLSNQSTPAPGLLRLTEEQEGVYLRHNGFVRIVSTEPTLTIEPDKEAWEAWKAAEAAKPVPEPEPTMEERNRADIDYLAALQGVSL